MSKNIAVINGPNLNMLGTRQPEIYGTTSLADIEKNLTSQFNHVRFSFFQSNHEGALIDFIQTTKALDGIVINPGALTHTSIALRDAIAACTIPVIEVHISNIFKRETFRHHSYISEVAKGIICGLGAGGYALAVQALLQ